MHSLETAQYRARQPHQMSKPTTSGEKKKLQRATSPHKNCMNQLIRPSIPLTKPHLPTLCEELGIYHMDFGEDIHLDSIVDCVCALMHAATCACRGQRWINRCYLVLALSLRQSFTEPRAQCLARQDHQQAPSNLKSCSYIYVVCTLPTKPSLHSQH